MTGASSAYRRDIDGLRAIAIVSVVGFHAFPEYPNGGFAGVDIFFVISGYLISGILMNELQAERFSILGFYARRCRRILPALIVLLAAVLVAGWFLLSPIEYAETGQEVLAAAVFASNMLMLQQIGYFDINATAKPLLHLWSLGIEEQFYLIWPLLLGVAHGRRWNLGAVIGILLLASFGSMLWFPAAQAFYLLPARFWELLLGGALAYLERYQPGRIDGLLRRGLWASAARRLPDLKGAVAMLLLVWAGIALGDDLHFPDWRALAPTVATVLLISAGGGGWINRRILSSSPAVFFGRISFPLYLWHWPLLSFAHIILGETAPVETRAVLMILATVLAWLTWRLVEQPVQRHLPNTMVKSTGRAGAVIVAASASALIVVGAFAGAVKYSDGIESWIPEAMREIDRINHTLSYTDYAAKMGLWTNGCHPVPAGWDGWCVSNNAAKASFAILGDSHALHYIPGLVNQHTASDGWLDISYPGCPPVLNIDVEGKPGNGHCDRINVGAQAMLKSRSDIKTVILSSLGTPYFNEIHHSPYPRDGAAILDTIAGHGSLKNVYYLGLSNSISALLSAGKRVVLMIDIPDLPFQIDRCLKDRPLKSLLAANENLPCSVSRIEYDERNKEYRHIVRMLKQAHPEILIYDPIDLVCDTKTCYMTHEGHSLYRDSDHLSDYGSQFIGVHFLRWMIGQGFPLSQDAREYAASDP
jgi:peptidoglycan/LPS O-acetylase OafA/YrhL